MFMLIALLVYTASNGVPTASIGAYSGTVYGSLQECAYTAQTETATLQMMATPKGKGYYVWSCPQLMPF